MSSALEVIGLSHSFGPRTVLEDLNFAVEPGQFSVLLGLNGAGKTTLFALVTRLYNARVGQIKVFGQVLSQHPSSCLAQMGVVFQQTTLDLDLTVEQNLYYHASLHGISRGEAAKAIALELGRIDLESRRRDKVRELSGGQRRRVEIARALLHRPKLLLLDEPTVGLDVASKQFILDHVRGLCKSEGLAVLWATHLFDEIDHETRLVVLHKGVILAQGSGADLIAQTGQKSVRDAFDELTKTIAKPAGAAA